METACKTYLSQPRILVTDEFIKKNNLSLIPEDKILDLLNNSDSFFGFEQGVYTDFISFEKVKSMFKDEYVAKVEAGEEEYRIVPFREGVQDFLDYMNFAWGKAEDQRGISASRSVDKLGAWLNVFNRPDLSELIHDDDLYNPYGAPALIAVCEKLGIEAPQSLIEFSEEKC